MSLCNCPGSAPRMAADKCINTIEKKEADQTMEGILIILSNISKGTAFLHQGVTNGNFGKLVRFNLGTVRYLLLGGGVGG